MGNHLKRVVFGLLAVVLCSDGASAQSVVHEGEGWSIELPEGWVQVESEELEMLNGMVSRDNRSSIGKVWVAGYAQQGSTFEGHSVLISEPGAVLAWSNFRRGAGGAEVVKVSSVMPGGEWTTKELVAELPLDAYTLDVSRRRVLVNQVEDLPGRGPREFAQIEYGETKGVMLTWQAGFNEDDFGPGVYAAVDSFAWGAGASTQSSIVLYLVVLGFPIAFVLALWIRIRFTIRKHKQRKLKQANR
ncbi:MAG: hypothetical protein ACI89L_000607 [Phycisphaerales bacterium]|jgi:hypothetical protein